MADFWFLVVLGWLLEFLLPDVVDLKDLALILS